MGEDNYVRVTVPPLVWNGFKGVGNEPAYVINMINEPHDPTEIRRMDPHESFINYYWSLKDR
jgi:dTDP-4-dehydrorhamnose 3,5-epimerase